MKKLYFLFLICCSVGMAQNVTITKVIETGCAIPFVKTVELYVDGTVDFSTDVVLNYMQNGAPWADNQIDISALGVQTDAFVYIVRDIPLMEAEFPSTTFDASNTVVVGTATNGDDGYQIVLNGVVVSQFGQTLTDGTGEAWEHVDAVATRKNGIPDIGVFDITHWDVTPLQSTDSQTACEGGAGLEAWFNTLGDTFPLGSGSGWTPTGDVCTTVLVSDSVACESTTVGDTNDTYTASIEFIGGNTGNTFVLNTTVGTIGGDNPTTIESGTIVISNIPEGTDITLTVSDTSDGGVCELTRDITSPDCIPLVLNEMLFDPPNDLPGDANGDGVRDFSDDEFVEFFNNSGSALDLSGYTLSDAAQVRHTFPNPTIVPANGVIVIFGGGTPTGTFGGAIVQTASEGTLNLNNGGDSVIITNPDGRVAINFDSSTIGISFGQDQSVTRNPDITGDFVLHTDANAALLYSPGLRVDGTTLSVINAEQINFVMYPNPVSNGFVTIQLNHGGEKEIEIYDLHGKSVFQSKTDSNVIDVQSLSTGLYLVKVTSDNVSQIKKLIIK